MKEKLKDVELMFKVFSRAATGDVNARWELAERKGVLRKILGKLNEARELPPQMRSYHSRQRAIYRMYGSKIGGEGLSSQYQIRKENVKVVDEQLSALNNEFADVLKANDVREEQAEELLHKEVEFELEPVERGWIGEGATSNDVELLMKWALVKRPGKEAVDKKGNAR